ncbi:MAG: hypothetical protein N3E40_02255 [Dehalococcoidia bacterium]|nr:hypothetical protein [Dehalococcoidia bacterium]
MPQQQPHSRPAKIAKGSRKSPALLAGMTLVLIGILLLLQSQEQLTADNWWRYFLPGLGIIFIIYAMVCFQQPGWVWKLATGLWLLLIGIVFLAGFARWWPLLLIMIGVWIVVRKAVR